MIPYRLFAVTLFFVVPFSVWAAIPTDDPAFEQEADDAQHALADPCESNGYYGDGFCDEDCVNPDPDCSELEPCTVDEPFRCPHGTCVADMKDCFPQLPSFDQGGCPDGQPVRCPDNRCVSSVQQCFVTGVEAQDSSERQPEALQLEESIREVLPLARETVSTEEVEELRTAMLSGNPNFHALAVEDETVTLEYTRTARLLGFIPVPYTLTLTVTPDGVQAQTPGWLFFVVDDAKETVKALEISIENDSQLQRAFGTPQAHAKRILEILSDVLRFSYDQ
ncbi:MAG: hypothetical protein WCX61_00710 [Candidatus Peribacteraceae bacterium]